MHPFKSLKLQLRPPKIDDPDFGRLSFIYISNHPERSYWEAVWTFPPTGMPVAIGLDGDESGPRPDSREWYLSLPSRFDRIVQLATPELAKVFPLWLKQELPDDIFTVVKLSGFGVEDPRAEPVSWDVSFETTGDTWLGISIPFTGDEAGKAVVDS
jgi:hypothetical protein